MGVRPLLRHVEPLAASILRAALPPDGPAAVAAGIDLRPWYVRYEPEAAMTVAAVIEGAWLIARADGRVDRVERGLLDDATRTLTRGGFRAEDVSDVLDAATRALLDEGLDARCRAVGLTLARRGVAAEGMRIILAIAAATEGISAAERDALGAIARAAGITDEALTALRDETLADLSAPDR